MGKTMDRYLVDWMDDWSEKLTMKEENDGRLFSKILRW
tara:strand:+ start:3199 stop:3312 length:114 start_codon:yes stop_codon:yes gene_type:complete